MDIQTFGRLIDADAILTRRRNLVNVSDYAEPDNYTLQEILSGVLTANEEKFEERCRLIGRRFGESVSFGGGSGTSRTPYVLLDVNNNRPWKKARFKIGKNPHTIRHNLSHLLFLDEHDEAGWSTSFAYGPSKESPLWIGMIQGYDDYAAKILSDDPENPLHLITLWDFMAQYGTKTNHRAESAHINYFLDLVRLKLDREITTSAKLADDRKEHWSRAIDSGVERILSSRRQSDVATWLLTDADPSNFTNLINGRPARIGSGDNAETIRSWVACFDQGYGASLIEDWLSQLRGSGKIIQPSDAFIGRIEYSLGWQNAAIQASRADSKIKNFYVNLMKQLVTTGKFNVPWPADVEQFKGLQKTYSLPLPHNVNLSEGFAMLGMASYLLMQMAFEGEQDDMTKVTDRVFNALGRNTTDFNIGDDLPRRNTS